MIGLGIAISGTPPSVRDTIFSLTLGLPPKT